jgi:hypothetical protein
LAENFLVSASGDSTSAFFHKLNVSQMGASGHSQGAGGAIQGYPTARMMYQLQDDNYSQGAFVNGTGEIIFPGSKFGFGGQQYPLTEPGCSAFDGIAVAAYTLLAVSEYRPSFSQITLIGNPINDSYAGGISRRFTLALQRFMRITQAIRNARQVHRVVPRLGALQPWPVETRRRKELRCQFSP